MQKTLKRFTTWSAMRLLEHPARRTITELCGTTPRSIQDLSRLLSLNPGSVHNHVHKLRDAGFLEVVEKRVINGIVEQKYLCTARQFDFSDMHARDVPKRNSFIARDVAREIATLMDSDGKTTVTRLAPTLSEEDIARVRKLMVELRQFIVERDGSGDVPCGFVVAFGRRNENVSNKQTRARTARSNTTRIE
jgi:predicted ArsR family transcriptional regulator